MVVGVAEMPVNGQTMRYSAAAAVLGPPNPH